MIGCRSSRCMHALRSLQRRQARSYRSVGPTSELCARLVDDAPVLPRHPPLIDPFLTPDMPEDAKMMTILKGAELVKELLPLRDTDLASSEKGARRATSSLLAKPTVIRRTPSCHGDAHRKPGLPLISVEQTLKPAPSRMGTWP